MDALWTPDAAEAVASAEGLALTERHWCVIASARELIARTECNLSLDDVSATCGMSLDELRQLFPGAAEDLLARLAGAPELERREAP